MQAAATLNAALAQPTLVIAPTTNDIAQGGQQEEAQVVPTVKGRKNSKFPSASAATEPATSAGRGTKRSINAAEAGANPGTSPQSVDAPLAKRRRTPKGAATITAPSSTPTLPPSRTTSMPASLSSIESAPAKVAIPPDAPKWFENALSMLQAKDLGAPWHALLQAWADFEVRHEFKEVAFLGAKNRPECIEEWMRRRRSATWKPPIKGVAAYESRFMSWWEMLQPDWRLLEAGGIDFSAKEGDWERLRKPGLRGLHNAIVGLFYWALEVENENKGHAQWLIAVDDCRVVCEHLSSAM